MKNVRLIFLSIACAAGLLAQSPILEVTGLVPQPLKLTAADFAALPHASLKMPEATYSGVWLHEILKRAGVPQGDNLRGKTLLQAVIAQSQDGYQVLLSLPEIDPGWSEAQILVADAADGKPLEERYAPLRLILAKVGEIRTRDGQMSARVTSTLAHIRKSRGIGAAELAKRVKVSRQTIYAIEAGTYVPNTEVALRLARELETSVDELFALPAEERETPQAVSTEVLAQEPPSKGQPVRLARIGARWMSVPVSASPYYLPEADGIVSRGLGKGAQRAEIIAFSQDESEQKRLILAGCDPATGLLSSMVERATGVEILSAGASSRLALSWLKDGKVHIAGSHLEDPATGEFNLPYLRRELAGEDLAVVTFASWEEGFVVAPGNPREVRKIEDLARRGTRFVNREAGSGSRALLDRLIAGAGVETARITGYERVARGHLAAAFSVLSGDADCCLATRSAARTFGLDFVAVHSERYDLVLRRKTLELPAAQAFLDVLQRASLRRKLETLAGYDTSQTGTLLS